MSRSVFLAVCYSGSSLAVCCVKGLHNRLPVGARFWTPSPPPTSVPCDLTGGPRPSPPSPSFPLLPVAPFSPTLVPGHTCPREVQMKPPKKYEGSKADMEVDKKSAKRLGMSRKAYEGSPVDKKKDAAGQKKLDVKRRSK